MKFSKDWNFELANSSIQIEVFQEWTLKLLMLLHNVLRKLANFIICKFKIYFYLFASNLKFEKVAFSKWDVEQMFHTKISPTNWCSLTASYVERNCFKKDTFYSNYVCILIIFMICSFQIFIHISCVLTLHSCIFSHSSIFHHWIWSTTCWKKVLLFINNFTCKVCLLSLSKFHYIKLIKCKCF